MATLQQCYLELNARRARLLEARINDWRDCIPAERQTVAEFEHALVQLLLDSATGKRLMQVAGAFELGPLPDGLSLSYSGADVAPTPVVVPRADACESEGGCV